jgi:hypothetical protein
MHGETSTERIDEISVFKGDEIFAGKSLQPRFGDYLNFSTLFGTREKQTIATTLMHRVVARSS